MPECVIPQKFYARSDIDFISELVSEYFYEKGIDVASYSWDISVTYDVADEVTDE